MDQSSNLSGKRRDCAFGRSGASMIRSPLWTGERPSESADLGRGLSRPQGTRSGQEGVTVSELVLVVVVLVGLIGVAVWAINGINADTATTNCETALRNLKTATEQYHSENDSYPVDKGVLIDLDYVEESDVSGWHLELTNASTPSYTGTGSCS